MNLILSCCCWFYGWFVGDVCKSRSTDAKLEMLNDELPFGVVREVVVPEDGAVVELG